MRINIRIRHIIASFGLALSLCLSLPPAWAGMPDPTRFGLTVEQGELDTVKEWLDNGLNPDFLADHIGSGLMVAAWEGNIAMMDLFLSHGAQINLSNRHDEQALQLAAWRGHLEAVRWLIDHGATVNRPGARWGALHYAAFANRREIARMLIERGADVNARVPNGSTVLMMAAREGHAELARQIIAAGADAQAVNERGESALTWAMRYEHFTIAQMVSSETRFAQAAKAAPASFGAPVRSVPAPPEIEEVLRQIRLAQAAGQPTDSLRQGLLAAVERFKRESRQLAIESPGARKYTRRGKPSALMITARRTHGPANKPDSEVERAELVYRERPAKMTAPEAPSAAATEPDELTRILNKIEHARETGQPTEALRQELYRSIARFKGLP